MSKFGSLSKRFTHVQYFILYNSRRYVQLRRLSHLFRKLRKSSFETSWISMSCECELMRRALITARFPKLKLNCECKIDDTTRSAFLNIGNKNERSSKISCARKPNEGEIIHKCQSVLRRFGSCRNRFLRARASAGTFNSGNPKRCNFIR